MRIKANLRVLALSSLAVPFAAACSSPGQTDVGSTEQLVLGDHFASADPAHFEEARAAFAATETVLDGLGPIFNERGCGVCHASGALGGAGEQIERRYGAIINGVFNPLANTGGSLRQLFGIGGFTPAPGVNCNTGTDSATPAGATINNVGRLTTPLFGLGLVDSLPDSVFTTIAGRQAATTSNIRGIANFVTILLPNILDTTQTQGGRRVGRFGWKAGVSNLAEFSADAYLNEMGITTTSCINGRVNAVFATENRANRAPSNAVINGCPDDQLPGVDDDLAGETNNCAGVHELQDDVALFTLFMAQLLPPPNFVPSAGTVEARGQALFNSANLQCSVCHANPSEYVSTSRGGVPAGIRILAYSDFLVHDMGTLGDGIGNQGDSVAVTRRMRTAPLWGVSARNRLLHDGRFSRSGGADGGIAAAIRAHDGEGAQARNAFNALNQTQRHELTQFVSRL